MRTRAILVYAACAVTAACGPFGPQVTRLQARPVPPTTAIDPGEHRLGLGATQRDGSLFVPRQASTRVTMPLLVWLHGGGGHSRDIRHLFPLADEAGVVVLAIDSRDNTWDGIDSPYGPDVRFIDAALRHTFQRVAIDPGKIALGGLSDGGAYALAIGLVNGDLFTHVVAVAPGFVAPPAPTVGRPRILLAHGTKDNVYSVRGTRDRIAPELRSAGYDVTYVEFEGPHWVPLDTARRILEWLAH